MPREILIPLLTGLLALPHGTLAQTALYETDIAGSGYEDMAVGESRDVPCEYGFSRNFAGHTGVPFEGYMFLSDWRSKRSDFPLPSWNWYYALPDRNPVSEDRRARWNNAEIQVHCWIYRAMYLLHHHRDVVAGAGQLVELCKEDRERIDIEAYDDGDTVPSSTILSRCSGDGGDGGGGGGGGTALRCYTVTIEHYWYYPDTGQMEYRYTEEQTYCEESSA